jgi:subtilisin family serine protease
VAAFGEVIAAGPKGFEQTQGTSFSSPLVAGFAACAWQANRQLTNMQLFKAIEKSGHLYPYFDYAHGFGVPQAETILNSRKDISPTFDFIKAGDTIKVVLKPQFFTDSGTTVLAGNELPITTDNTPYLYYHIADTKNILQKYYVLEILQPEAFYVLPKELKPGYSLRVHYRGYTGTYTF